MSFTVDKTNKNLWSPNEMKAPFERNSQRFSSVTSENTHHTSLPPVEPVGNTIQNWTLLTFWPAEFHSIIRVETWAIKLPCIVPYKRTILHSTIKCATVHDRCASCGRIEPNVWTKFNWAVNHTVASVQCFYKVARPTKKKSRINCILTPRRAQPLCQPPPISATEAVGRKSCGGNYHLWRNCDNKSDFVEIPQRLPGPGMKEGNYSAGYHCFSKKYFSDRLFEAHLVRRDR